MIPYFEIVDRVCQAYEYSVRYSYWQSIASDFCFTGFMLGAVTIVLGFCYLGSDRG